MPEGIFVIVLIFWAIRAYFRFMYNSEKIEYASSPANHFSLSLISDRLGGTINSDGTYCSGIIEGFSYSLKAEVKGGYVLFINHKLPFDGLMNITKENIASKLKKKFGQDDIQTGDISFDEQMLLDTSNPEELAGLLCHKNRTAILELSFEFNYLQISKSWIKADIDFNVPSERIPDLVKQSVELSKAFMKTADINTMLVYNVLNDSKSGVRLNNLKLFARRYRKSKELVEICEKAQNDTSIEVQIEASSHLGSQGMEHIASMVEKQKFSDNEVLRIIKIFSENSYRKGIPLLKKMYGQKEDKKTRKKILKMCRTYADTGLSSFLVEELCNGTSSLSSEVLDALGTCGDRRAFETIHELYKDYMPGSARNEAYGILAQIQSRLGVDKGWLSVAEHAEGEGALSMANDETEGGLSLADEKDSEK